MRGRPRHPWISCSASGAKWESPALQRWVSGRRTSSPPGDCVATGNRISWWNKQPELRPEPAAQRRHLCLAAGVSPRAGGTDREPRSGDTVATHSLQASVPAPLMICHPDRGTSLYCCHPDRDLLCCCHPDRGLHSTAVIPTEDFSPTEGSAVSRGAAAPVAAHSLQASVPAPLMICHPDRGLHSAAVIPTEDFSPTEGSAVATESRPSAASFASRARTASPKYFGIENKALMLKYSKHWL